jgi:hypothetical protein
MDGIIRTEPFPQPTRYSFEQTFDVTPDNYGNPIVVRVTLDGFGQCLQCGAKTPCLELDNCEGEYWTPEFCKPCIDGFFEKAKGAADG